MPADTTYSVIIIGAGITGLSAVYHLHKQNITNVVIISDHDQKTAAHPSCGIASGGSVDNFTRLHHAWGTDFAREIWQFGNESFQQLKNFCIEKNVGIAVGDRLRFAAASLEIREIKQAHSLLKQSGFASYFQDHGPEGLPKMAAQVERHYGAVVDREELRSALWPSGSGSPEVLAGRAVELSADAHGIRVRLADASVLSAEMVLVATHLNIPALVPSLEPALVSYADQWHKIRYQTDTFSKELVGTVFSFNHGYAWGAVTSPREAVIGGGRQMRKFAGIGATEISINPKSSSWLLGVLQKMTGCSEQPEITHSEGFLECRPCDEIPVIGPMFGENRILVATGYSGSGLTVGFHAGKCVADLIATGASSELPLRFHPARLRSLAD